MLHKNKIGIVFVVSGEGALMSIRHALACIIGVVVFALLLIHPSPVLALGGKPVMKVDPGATVTIPSTAVNAESAMGMHCTNESKIKSTAGNDKSKRTFVCGSDTRVGTLLCSDKDKRLRATDYGYFCSGP